MLKRPPEEVDEPRSWEIEGAAADMQAAAFRLFKAIPRSTLVRRLAPVQAAGGQSAQLAGIGCPSAGTIPYTQVSASTPSATPRTPPSPMRTLITDM